ncbi:hypothetical protein PBAL39_03359 [Pedobacter sp. BAL39]|uniref:hypothetical protein n=1 Tax=Pedobacter sp. BAL39 TaxID=391596 RepID=UPI000155AA2B|nr:hypothetical protein [Pedobacter sp. BAL39]EDM34174.1 hypothetical protein PBAL39_03359 [Pedobacter sp. BAL39]
MSIYLEFPAIAEYPLYPNPFRNDQEVFFPEDELPKVAEEKITLHDYLTLKMV